MDRMDSNGFSGLVVNKIDRLGHEDGITEIRILDAGLYGGKVVRRHTHRGINAHRRSGAIPRK